MNNKKIIINIFGYSCAGKSTIAAGLKEKILDVYTLDFDKQKLRLLAYDRTRHYSVLQEVMYGFFDVLCKTGAPIILLMPVFRTEEEYLRYETLAEKHGYVVLSFEIIATREVLIKRYRERLVMHKEKGIGKSARTEEEYITTIELAYYIPQNSMTFDTTNTNPSEIIEKIVAEYQS